MTNLLAYLESGLPVDTLYPDFAKAFDKVPHRRLLMKLKAHGIDGVVLDVTNGGQLFLINKFIIVFSKK